jgi:hypothetical protein
MRSRSRPSSETGTNPSQKLSRPYRILYAFDPTRTALLLLGGDKTGGRWYEKMVPKADAIYEKHLKSIK